MRRTQVDQTRGRAGAGGRGPFRGQLARFLAVGVLSYGVDIGGLYLLHGQAHVRLWLATAAAFTVSLVVNFALNRTVTFAAGAGVHQQAVRYLTLVVASLLATIGIVTGLTALGTPYLVSKTTSTAVLACVNFFAYRHWVFRDSDTHESVVASTEGFA